MAGEGGNGESAASGTAGLGVQNGQITGVSGLPTQGDATLGSDSDSRCERIGLRDDFDESHISDPKLLDWPHELWTNCVCQDNAVQDMDFDEFYQAFRDQTSMDRVEMKEYHSLLWAHESFLVCDEPLDRKPGRAGIIYEDCTPRDLKRMTIRRGFRDPYPSGVTLKFFYIRPLRQNDRQSTFRFMDLPPELRVNVCRLLIATGYSKPREVAILRTCRQVYEESKHLPYSEPTILVKFIIGGYSGKPHTRALSIHGDIRYLNGPHGRFYCLPRSIDDYPEYMRHAHRLEVHLSYRDSHVDPGIVAGFDCWSEFNQFLFGLASFLMEGHQLKVLTIYLELPDGVENAAFEKCLYPLRRVRNVPNIRFEGNIPQHIKPKLESDMSSCEPVFNTLRQWRLLQDEASAQIDLLEEMGCFGCDCGECSPGERAEQIMFRLQSLGEARPLCCTSSAHEENFLARLGMLKMTLQLVDIAQLRRDVQTVAEKRKAVTRYDQSTDDERLNEAIELWGMDIYKREAIAARDNHDWSDDGEDEAEVDEQGVSADPNQQKLLSDRVIADIFKRWAPDGEGTEQQQIPRSCSAPSSNFTDPDNDFGDA